MGNDLGNFCLGDAILPADAQVGGDLFEIAARNQCGNGDETARAGRQLLLARPDLSEQDIIVQFGELGGEVTQPVAASRLFLGHEAFLHGIGELGLQMFLGARFAFGLQRVSTGCLWTLAGYTGQDGMSFGPYPLMSLQSGQPLPDLCAAFLGFCAFHDEQDAIALAPALKGQTRSHTTALTQAVDLFEAAAHAVAGMGFEGCHGLALQIMAGQKAADRWRQLHAPGGKTNEYPVELLQVVEAGSERRR